MSYGIQVNKSDGSLMFNMGSETQSLIDTITIAPGSTGSQTYPGHVGWVFSIAVTQDSTGASSFASLVDFTSPTITISYPSGVPTINWSPGLVVGVAQTVRVLVLGV